MSFLERRDVPMLPLSRLDIALEILGAVLLLAISGIVLTNYSATPESIPMHFNGRGDPDSWGPKGGLLLLPGIALALFVGLTVATRLPSRFLNIPIAMAEKNAPAHYALARTLLRMGKVYALALFSYITWAQVQTALGQRAGLGGGFLPVTLVATALLLVFYLVQAKRIGRSRI